MAHDLVELADQAKARANDPDTSHEAAEAITAQGLRKLQVDVLGYAFKRGDEGFTDFEMQEYFDDQGSTHRARRSELRDFLLVEDSGERRKKGGKGRNFTVWRITEKGRTFYKGVDHGRIA